MYSLTAFSDEELVTRDFLLKEKPEVVIDVIDTSTLERQLYLAVQLIELGLPLVLAFNMSDMAERSGMKLDVALLSKLLGAPIVPTVGSKGKGIKELLETAVNVAEQRISVEPKPLSYGRILDSEISRLESMIEKGGIGNPRWIAVKLLEGDAQVLKDQPDTVKKALDESRRRLSAQFSDPVEMLVPEARYGIISGAVSEAMIHTVEVRHEFSDQVDSVLIHPTFGIPIFLVLMYLVFALTFRLGNPLTGLMQSLFHWLGATVSGFWPEGTASPVESLIVNGVIGGVGGVMAFLPNILLLFAAIAFLEDSGYMSRAAFIMDRAMHSIGLHGKSFIPMLIGFGCSVPAIMGTRILESRRDRLATIMVIPLMSCSARLPIYSLIIPAFFPLRLQAPMLWLIYAIGVGLAVVLTKLLRVTVLCGESTPFIMELPPYRIPSLRGLAIHAWERGSGYLRKAGTIILAISIVLWWASSYPSMPKADMSNFANRTSAVSSEQKLTNSYLGRVSKAIEPGLKTMGFDWKIGTALMGAIAAKEVFVAQLGIIYSEGGDKGSLREALQKITLRSPVSASCCLR